MWFLKCHLRLAPEVQEILLNPVLKFPLLHNQMSILYQNETCLQPRLFILNTEILGLKVMDIFKQLLAWLI